MDIPKSLRRREGSHQKEKTLKSDVFTTSGHWIKTIGGS